MNDKSDTATPAVLDNSTFATMHRFWSACNYLAAGMIYLQDNPLQREPLNAEHIKAGLLGHWGSSPGLSFVYNPPQSHYHPV